MKIRRKLLRFKRALKRTVKGLTSVSYEARLAEGDSWANYFGNFEGQKYGWFDTNNCWNYSGIESLETQLEWLEKNGRIPAETLAWCVSKGYKDEDGDWYLSRRWGAILSGVKDSGNDILDFWDIVAKAGVIPNHMLPYKIDGQGNFIATLKQFQDDYFNPQVITKEMELVGKEFARRFKMFGEELGTRYTRRSLTLLQSALKESPLCIAIPGIGDGTWNMTSKKKWNGNTSAEHAAEMYEVDDLKDKAYPYFIYDSYEPHLKQLSNDYYIPWVIRGVITPNPIVVVQEKVKTFTQKLWEAIYSFLLGRPIPAGYPIG